MGRYGGLVKNMPKYATLFMIFMLGSVGLPGTSGFVGEFLTLMGAFQASTWVALFATTGVVLGAAYMLVLYRRVIFGESVNADASAMPDVTGLEKFYLIPLALLVIALGVMPGLVMDRVSPTIEALRINYISAINAYEQTQEQMDLASGTQTISDTRSSGEPAP
jgi:NADH-quinone oxidoreductase subunit M